MKTMNKTGFTSYITIPSSVITMPYEWIQLKKYVKWQSNNG